MSDQKTPLTEKEQDKIWSFVEKQTVLNFATSANNTPWCATCYYAFDKKHKLLIFKTANDSRHMQEALQQVMVAGTVLPDKPKKGVVKGIQFQGEMVFSDEEIRSRANKKYHKKFPFAKVMAGEIAVIELTLVKLTDNKLGFGKRLLWEKE
jgi:uncharacterized protein YhbP (UPF0306 family)